MCEGLRGSAVAERRGGARACGSWTARVYEGVRQLNGEGVRGRAAAERRGRARACGSWSARGRESMRQLDGERVRGRARACKSMPQLDIESVRQMGGEGARGRANACSCVRGRAAAGHRECEANGAWERRERDSQRSRGCRNPRQFEGESTVARGTERAEAIGRLSMAARSPKVAAAGNRERREHQAAGGPEPSRRWER